MGSVKLRPWQFDLRTSAGIVLVSAVALSICRYFMFEPHGVAISGAVVGFFVLRPIEGEGLLGSLAGGIVGSWLSLGCDFLSSVPHPGTESLGLVGAFFISTLLGEAVGTSVAISLWI